MTAAAAYMTAATAARIVKLLANFPKRNVQLRTGLEVTSSLVPSSRSRSTEPRTKKKPASVRNPALRTAVMQPSQAEP